MTLNALNSCSNCRHFEADQEDGNDGMGQWYEVCRARNGVSNLKSFPFKRTKCATFTTKEEDV